MSLVQRLDTLACVFEQRGVVRLRLRCGIGKIRQQAEAQVRVAIGEEPDFECLDELVDTLDAPARARWPLDPEAEKVRGAGVKA